jgi:hypothetical protein
MQGILGLKERAMSEHVEILNDMIGKTFDSVTGSEGGSQMVFSGPSGKMSFFHLQDCCEGVSIDDVCGDLSCLAGSPILQAEEVSRRNDGPKPSEYSESWTWTFYKFATVKGSVTVRWLGESNGYYSESVDHSWEPTETDETDPLAAAEGDLLGEALAALRKSLARLTSLHSSLSAPNFTDRHGDAEKTGKVIADVAAVLAKAARKEGGA